MLDPALFQLPGTKYKDLILANASELKDSLTAIITFMQRYESWLVLPSVLIAAGGVCLWLQHEWRANRFQNRARLSAASGTLLISTALFWANPVEAFIAFAFSHAVGTWSLSGRSRGRLYYRPRPQPSLMQRLLHYPRAWYVTFTAFFVAAGIAQILWGQAIMKGVKPVEFFGMTGAMWLFYYAVYESLVHFYMDGFLWKMRRPAVREYLTAASLPPSVAHSKDPIVGSSLAGCGKSLRSLHPLSYLPPVRGRRLRKEAIFYAGCGTTNYAVAHETHFFRTLLGSNFHERSSFGPSPWKKG